jgi:hypothetical protein
VGSDRKDGVVTVHLEERYYLKHKEVLDKFIMKGACISPGGSAEADLITFINWTPIGGPIRIIDDPAFVAYLRLTGGL